MDKIELNSDPFQPIELHGQFLIPPPATRDKI